MLRYLPVTTTKPKNHEDIDMILKKKLDFIVYKLDW